MTVQRSLDLLVPAFRERTDLVKDDLREEGFDPVTHETLRSFERSAELVAAGTSQVKNGPSMHCYRIAEDILCRKHRWSCAEHGCGFYDALHRVALKHGLTRVRLTNPKTGVKYWDGPHIQAIPVSMQALVRSAAPEHIDTLVRTYFAGLVRA